LRLNTCPIANQQSQIENSTIYFLYAAYDSGNDGKTF
jgi:hypothetical protein